MDSRVVDVAVTRGQVLGPAGYRRVTTLSGGPADLSEGGEGLYLWCKRAESGSFVTGLSVAAADEPVEQQQQSVALDGGVKLVVHRGEDRAAVLEVLAELEASSSDGDRIAVSERATLVVCRTEAEIPSKVEAPKKKGDAPSVGDVWGIEAELCRRELSGAARRRRGPKTPPPTTTASLGQQTTPSPRAEEWWEKQLEPFLDRATAAARDDFRDRELGAATHRLCRRAVEAVARRLASPHCKVDAVTCRVLNIALVSGGAVAAERVAWCSVHPKTPREATVQQAAELAEAPSAHKSRFFGFRGGTKPAAAATKGHTPPAAALEARPLRRPPRAAHPAPPPPASAGSPTTAAAAESPSEWAAPLEPLLGGAQAAWEGCRRRKSAAGVDPKDVWPLDDCSESEGDEPEARHRDASLDARVALRFAKGATEGSSSFFCGDAALGLRRAREKIGDEAPIFDDALGSGVLLDHLARAGGLDALVARLSPAARLECDVDALVALLGAVAPSLARAAPATSPALARHLARALQRAANARIRDLAQARSSPGRVVATTAQLDAARVTLSRALAKLAPDAFVVSGHPLVCRAPSLNAMSTAASTANGANHNGGGAATASATATASGMPATATAAAGTQPQEAAPARKQARGPGSRGEATAAQRTTWKQHLGSYWGGGGGGSSPTQSPTPVDLACRAARASAERLELDVASARLFRGDDENDDAARLEGVASINAVAASFAGSAAAQQDEAQATGRRPAGAAVRRPPPWVVGEAPSGAAAAAAAGAGVDWQMGEARFAAWLAKRDVPAAVIALAVRRREALEVGLEALSLAARCGPFSPTLVDALATLCVHDADDEAASRPASARAWVSLAARLPLELVARQRDELATAYRRRDVEPSGSRVYLVASFARVAAPRLLRAAAQAGADPQQPPRPSPSANKYLEGGLELLWRWAVRDVPADDAALEGRRLAAKAIASILRRPASSTLDRPSLQCAELCVERLEQRPAHAPASGDDGGCGDRVCRLLAALVVAREESAPATHVYARRRALERKRGSLVRLALKRVSRDAREGRDPRAALRLVVSLAAEQADDDGEPPKYYFARLSMEDVGLVSRFAGASFFAVAAERRALEPRAAEKALLELAAAPPSADDPRAAVALFETALLNDDDDSGGGGGGESQRDARLLALLDALVLVSLRAPPLDPRAALLLARVARSPLARARVATRCVSAATRHDRAAAALLRDFFRAAGPARSSRLPDDALRDALAWLADDLAAAAADARAKKLRVALALAQGDEGWRAALAARGFRERLAATLKAGEAAENLALQALDATLPRSRDDDDDDDDDDDNNNNNNNNNNAEPRELWAALFPTLAPDEAKRTLSGLVSAVIDVAQRDRAATLATRLVLSLARLERRTTVVLDALAKPAFGKALRRALLPPRGAAPGARDRRRLRGEAFGLARESAARGPALVLRALLEPLGAADAADAYDRDAYARCCELVAALLDELRAHADAVDRTTLSRVADRLALDLVSRRARDDARREDEEPCDADEDGDENDDENHHHHHHHPDGGGGGGGGGGGDSAPSSRDAAFFASDAFATDGEDGEDGEDESEAGRIENPRAPAAPQPRLRHEARVAATTLERARFALLGALVRCGARPATRAVVAAARHLAARCELGGAAPPGDVAEAPFEAGDGIAAAATRAVAIDTLAALCDASPAALGDVCDLVARLHEDAGAGAGDEDEDSVPAKLEAADVVRAAHHLQQPGGAAQLATLPRNRNNPPATTSQQQQQQQQRPDFIAGGGATFLSRFSSVIVPARRPHHGFAGLENLGCTCYLNSTLQLLASARAFRSAVYALDAAANSDETHQRLARELQLLVARLALRDAASISPRAFCDSFKTWDGEPIDVRQQQDASEFIANLFQQLERMAVRRSLDDDDDVDDVLDKTFNVRGGGGGGGGGHQQGEAEDPPLLLEDGSRHRATAASRLERAFGGVFAHELSALSDPATHTSRRDEPFYLLSVQVKDRSRLEDALQAFVAPEVVEYAWRDGGRREKTSKGVTIRKAPRHLLVHLKRFEFDLETLTQRKINTRFEFPQTLDLAPFLTKARDATEDVEQLDPGGGLAYDLGGIVVHAGTAHSGHYYSFVREPDGAWFEFNDAYVAPFDADAELAAECFGGAEPPPRPSHFRYATAPEPPAPPPQLHRERTRNAFLLVYHRRRHAPKNPEKITNGYDDDEPPAATRRLVSLENDALRKARATFDEAGLAFAATLVDKGLHAPDADDALRRRAASLGVALCVRTLARARDDDAAPLLAKCASAVAAALARGDAEDAAAQLILGRDDGGTTSALVDALRRAAAHPDEAAREALCALFAAALAALFAARRKRPLVAAKCARALVSVAATDDRDLLRPPLSPTPPQPPRQGHNAKVPARRDHRGDVFFERGPSRAACDALAIFASDPEAAAWLADLAPGDDKNSTALASLVGAACAASDPPRTTRRRLAAFATRAELLAKLFRKKAKTALDSDDAAVVTAVVGAAALVDRGRFSKRGADEGRRRSAAARRFLETLVADDAHKSHLALSVLAALVDRCHLGLARVRRRRAKRDDSSRVDADQQQQQHREDGGDDDDDDDDDEILELDALDDDDGGADDLLDDDDEDDDDDDDLRLLDDHQHHKARLAVVSRERFSYSTDFLRRAWRALACVLSVDDSLRHFRVTKGLSRAVAATELASRRRPPRKLRASIEELLRLCKRDAAARDWVRAHPRACDWLLDATPDVPNPDAHHDSPNFNFVGASLDTLRAPLGAVASGVRSWTSARRGTSDVDPARRDDRRDEDVARRVRVLLQLSPTQLRRQDSDKKRPPPDDDDDDALAPYDSDDDPAAIVGRRIKVRWAGGTYYSGTITNYDDLGHHVSYDDGDARVYSDILAKTFVLLKDEPPK
ncbi:hypothetical protein CTAYLR_001501 [Chrysophaeum taylorii]|uniref:USP domain-containing protein n=1 Tax=Chrysophaeum taylorii TaxID=2483200 RepID=A0AAD7XLS7_9STRA|nr:hypothetical protein CTAYLR_001501 [Chrysophaeum taylorii]